MQWMEALFFNTSKWILKNFIPGGLKCSFKIECAKQKTRLEFNSDQRFRMVLSMESTRQLKIISVKILRVCI